MRPKVRAHAHASVPIVRRRPNVSFSPAVASSGKKEEGVDSVRAMHRHCCEWIAVNVAINERLAVAPGCTWWSCHVPQPSSITAVSVRRQVSPEILPGHPPPSPTSVVRLPPVGQPSPSSSAACQIFTCYSTQKPMFDPKNCLNFQWTFLIFLLMREVFGRFKTTFGADLESTLWTRIFLKTSNLTTRFYTVLKVNISLTISTTHP